MLDLTGIMFSSIMMLMVIVRAMQLDRSQPWFQKIKPKQDTSSPEKRVWQRRN